MASMTQRPRWTKGSNQYRKTPKSHRTLGPQGTRNALDRAADGQPLSPPKLLANAAHRDVFERLHASFDEEGHQLVVVGGAVRAMLRGEEPKDIDLCTSATPEETERLLESFGTVFPLGREFGTIAVAVDGDDYEITTFRSEKYPDAMSRKPEVEYGGDLRGDLARRDFTMNAAAVTVNGDIIDPFGAAEDIEAKIIRSVGDPERRFDEDPLRIVRAARFASTMSFDIEEQTGHAMTSHAERLRAVSAERIWAEVTRTFGDGNEFSAFINAARDHGIEQQIFGIQTTGQPPQGIFAQYGWLTQQGADLKAMKAPNSVIETGQNVLDVAQAESDIDHREAVRRHPDAIINAAQELRPRADVRDPDERALLRQKLPVNGNDLQSLGLEGPEIGRAIRFIERSLLEDPRPLDAEECVRLVRRERS